MSICLEGERRRWRNIVLDKRQDNHIIFPMDIDMFTKVAKSLYFAYVVILRVLAIPFPFPFLAIMKIPEIEQ